MTIKTLRILVPLSMWAFFGQNLTAQTSLLDELGKDEVTTEYVKYSFKTNRVINLHSLESTAAGVMDFKMSHRFNPVDKGLYDLFGLDGAQQRFGFDFGLTDNLTVGVNRNSYKKALDGFVKYRILRQSTGKANMPITLAATIISPRECFTRAKSSWVANLAKLCRSNSCRPSCTAISWVCQRKKMMYLPLPQVAAFG
jgi:Membrane bound beta barrel domain (DUF5777)